MRIGHVSHGDFPPPQNHPSVGAAASHHVLTSVGDIADLIASAGTKAVSRVASSGDTQTANASLQVYADLAEIDLYLAAHKGQTTFNDPFLAKIIANLKAQSGACDSTAQSLIAAALGTFTINGNTISFSTGLNNFSSWWKNPNNGGFATMLSDLKNNIALSGLQPSVTTNSQPNAPDTPAVFVNMGMIFADAMLRGGNNITALDKLFWGGKNPLKSGNLGQAFPYAVVAYAYQMEFNEGGAGTWAAVDQDVQNLFSLLPTPSTLTYDNVPNYLSMYTLFSQHPDQFGTIQSFDAWKGKTPLYSFFSNPSDLSQFYRNALDPLYNNAMSALNKLQINNL